MAGEATTLTVGWGNGLTGPRCAPMIYLGENENVIRLPISQGKDPFCWLVSSNKIDAQLLQDRAALIVRAVNGYDAAVTALEALHNAAKRLCEAAWHDGQPSAIQEWANARKGLDEVLTEAQAALAALKGTS